MRLPEGYIQELKARCSIEDMASRYTQLKRRGSLLVGCCPFHSEKTPSFTLYTGNDPHFYCFGCGVGGDVVTFTMLAENLDYMAAVTRLAEQYGMSLPEADDTNRDSYARMKRMYQLNRDAALYFHKLLLSPEGASALGYLGQRGLTASSIKHFGLGYADASWDGTSKHLAGLGYGEDEIKAAFLAGTNKNGRIYDYFRNRIIFPIIDTSSNIVAFGGRAISGDGPKYLNTSDTPVFKKRRNLYGLNFARKTRRDFFILCEGYMDAIAVHCAGYENTVATLGTAVTDDHARIISKYVKRAVLAYDNDDAGRRAADKASELLGRVGVEVRILSLNGAKDPDEYIKKFGADRFSGIVDSSKTYIENRLDIIKSQYNTDLTDEKIRAINEACALLSRLPQGPAREVYTVRAAELFATQAETIARELSRLDKKGRKTQNTELFKAAQSNLIPRIDKINEQSVKFPLAVKAESEILGIILKYPELYDYTVQNISPDDFLSDFNRRVFEECAELRKAGGISVSAVIAGFTAEEAGRIVGMAVARDNLANNEAVIAEAAGVVRREKERAALRAEAPESKEEWARSLENAIRSKRPPQ